MKALRILSRNIRDAFYSVFRNFSLSLASISCITITLLVVTISIILTYNVNNFSSLVEKDITIVTFLNVDIDEEGRNNVRKEIEKLPNIESIEYQDKVDITKDMMKSSETFKNIMGSWSNEENPIQSTYLVKVKDIEKMMKKVWFPQCYLDDQKTSLMLGDQMYQQYRQAMESKQQRETLEKQCRQNPDSLEAVIAEGRKCIRQIRSANDLLPEEEISEKLDRLETVIIKIFSYVEQHPEKLSEIRRFMNYYLPTTIKLVKAYCDFEQQPVQVQSIVTAKKEIDDTLTVISTAFETLLDSLYQDDALDISTDISALKTILTQEGLVKDNSETKKQ